MWSGFITIRLLTAKSRAKNVCTFRFVHRILSTDLLNDEDVHTAYYIRISWWWFAVVKATLTQTTKTIVHTRENCWKNWLKCSVRWTKRIKKDRTHTHTHTNFYGENDFYVGFTLQAMRQIDTNNKAYYTYTQVDPRNHFVCTTHDILVSKRPYTMNGRLKINVLFWNVLFHSNAMVFCLFFLSGL